MLTLNHSHPFMFLVERSQELPTSNLEMRGTLRAGCNEGDTESMVKWILVKQIIESQFLDKKQNTQLSDWS